ncbi:hypothetical protein [Bacillus sp. FJAT-47783]|uniref:hypothetical protein n=1 Tax=Bacillus sp. FJAT-47783 TaxID=2922712 RepID=UPI001FAD72D2|nr:hypothetical protein [Bacillus sp. FJAT-47783]
MNILLFVVSFILHIVTIYGLVVLYVKYQSVKQLEQSQKQLLQQTEEALSLFLLEVKDENEKFLQSMEERIDNNIKQDDKIKVEETPFIYSKQKEESHHEQVKNHKATEIPEHLQSLLQKKDEDVLEMNHKQDDDSNDLDGDIQKQVMDLKKIGYTIEEIAQQLKVGKTEIELFIKFQENQ